MHNRKLPKRLQIEFKSTRPTYELYTPKGCSRRDLKAAGLPEETISYLLWNDYANKEVRYTLIQPEEWFWTDRGWWSEDSPHVDALYDLAGGAFCDLVPDQQAKFLGVDFLRLSGKKRGNSWIAPDGRTLDIVRYARELLILDGYRMAQAYSGLSSILYFVHKHAKEGLGVDTQFIDSGSSIEAAQRSAAKTALRDVLADPAKFWNVRPQLNYDLANAFRKVDFITVDTLINDVELIGRDALISILDHFYEHRTYHNGMKAITAPLVGRKGEELRFFFVTQHASFDSLASCFVRDYAKPLGLNVTFIQLVKA